MGDYSESIPSEEEFDPETKLNTVFNGDRENFVKAQQQKEEYEQKKRAENVTKNSDAVAVAVAATAAVSKYKRFASLEDLSSISTSSAPSHKQVDAEAIGNARTAARTSHQVQAEKSMPRNGTPLTPIVQQVDRDREEEKGEIPPSGNSDLAIDSTPTLPCSLHYYSSGCRSSSSSSSEETLSLRNNDNHSNDTLTLTGLSQFTTSVEVEEENSIDHQARRKFSLTSVETDESTYDNVPASRRKRAASSNQVLASFQIHQQPHLLPQIELHELKQYSGKKTGIYSWISYVFQLTSSLSIGFHGSLRSKISFFLSSTTISNTFHFLICHHISGGTTSDEN